MSHTHKCSHCSTPVDCDAELVRNYDGWPETTCEQYHLGGGVTNHVFCQTCWELLNRCDEMRDRQAAN